MEILGLITARSGSKSIPGKNLVPLAGKPMLAYTCKAALRCRALARVVLDTDDETIAQVGRDWGVEVPYLRPARLAQDDTLHIQVLEHCLSRLEKEENYRPDVLVLLQPTSPLRRTEHIEEAIHLLLESGADTVVSVVPVPHHFSPVSVMQLNEQGCLEPFLEGDSVLRRQDKPKVFARNGPAVLATRREVIENGRLYGDAVRPYEMAWADSVDIDDADDLELAEMLLARRKVK